MHLLGSLGGYCLGWRCSSAESTLCNMVPLRSLVLCFLGLCASVSCSSSDHKSVETVAGPAGSVLKVTGSATATQEGKQSRALVNKDVIYRDDTIATGPASSLVIEIAHNNARWEIGAGYVGRVDQSLSWRAKRQSVSALQQSESIATAAAGRNSEGEAAQSQENLEPREGEARSNDKSVPEVETSETPMAAAQLFGNDTSGGNSKDSKSVGSGVDTGGKTRGGLGSIGKGPGGSAGTGSLSGKAPEVVVRVAKLRVEGEYAPKIVRRVMQKHLARLLYCYHRTEAVQTESGTVAVRFAISTEGKVGEVKLSGDLQPIHKCVTQSLQHILFPKPSGVKVQLQLQYIPQ